MLKSQQELSLKVRSGSGRITASRFRAACKTSIEKQSLIRAICYPESTKFTSVATAWGCQHERVAQERYNLEMKTVHDNF